MISPRNEFCSFKYLFRGSHTLGLKIPSLVFTFCLSKSPLFYPGFLYGAIIVVAEHLAVQVSPMEVINGYFALP